VSVGVDPTLVNHFARFVSAPHHRDVEYVSHTPAASPQILVIPIEVPVAIQAIEIRCGLLATVARGKAAASIGVLALPDQRKRQVILVNSRNLPIHDR